MGGIKFMQQRLPSTNKTFAINSSHCSAATGSITKQIFKPSLTVNRIPHGYAYWYWGLDDPEWAPGQAPHEIGRKQFGRISIANADSQARPYMDGAFDAAFRAVDEQLA